MNAEIVIVGAGISGTAIAWNLAKSGMKGIVVVDRGDLTNGSTGRCGAGVREQWATRTNCLLAQKSIEFYEHAAEILGYPGDIEFKQEGYLILACTEAEVVQFAKNVELQHSFGIPSRWVDPAGAKAIVPHLNEKAIYGATFCPKDGHLNPFATNDAFFRAAKALGVTFLQNETVTGIRVENGRIASVETDKRIIATPRVVDAAGGYAADVASLAGIDLPVIPERHEILVTEPVERMQGPMVMSFSQNLYCQQSPHGSFLMGRGDPDAPRNHDLGSGWRFLDEMAKTVKKYLPAVAELRVVRQWAGSYAMSPDRQPILGAVPQVEGFYAACGFSGHGFMFAPMTGLLLSEVILGKTPSLDMSELGIGRFQKEAPIEVEKSVV